MCDETETIRREMVATINADPGSRPDLESQAWTGVGHERIAERLSKSSASWLRSSSCGGGRMAFAAA